MHFKNLVDCNGGGKTTMIFDVLREPMTPPFFRTFLHPSYTLKKSSCSNFDKLFSSFRKNWHQIEFCEKSH